MELNFETAILEANREKLYKIAGQLSEGQLFCIPQGFNNNVLWHLGHIVTSQQRLLYYRSNLPMRINDSFAGDFKIGTSPATWVSKPEIEEVRSSLLDTVKQLKTDISNNIFIGYEPFNSSMGIKITNFTEAFAYSNFHEAEHTGNIMYMLKLIQG